MTHDDSDRRRPPGDLGSEEAEQEGVRRLLAAVRDDPPPPMPDAVVHRLDDVLAELVSQRSGSSTGDADSTAVSNLSQKRDQKRDQKLDQTRARRWPKVLVAAATVTVVGMGIGNVMRDTGSSGSSDAGAETAGAGADARGLSQEDSPPDALPKRDQGGPDPASANQSAAKDRGAQARTLPELRSETLRADARRFAGITLDNALTTASPRTPGRCAVPATGQGDDLVSVRLDGKAATMVLRAGEGGVRLVQVYACDSARSPVASTTVDAN